MGEVIAKHLKNKEKGDVIISMTDKNRTNMVERLTGVEDELKKTQKSENNCNGLWKDKHN